MIFIHYAIVWNVPVKYPLLITKTHRHFLVHIPEKLIGPAFLFKPDHIRTGTKNQLWLEVLCGETK